MTRIAVFKVYPRNTLGTGVAGGNLSIHCRGFAGSKLFSGAPLVVQWLRIHLSVPGTQVQSHSNEKPMHPNEE